MRAKQNEQGLIKKRNKARMRAIKEMSEKYTQETNHSFLYRHSHCHKILGHLVNNVGM